MRNLLFLLAACVTSVTHAALTSQEIKFLTDATWKIKHQLPGNSNAEESGTAFLIYGNYLLTADHVVHDKSGNTGTLTILNEIDNVGYELDAIVIATLCEKRHQSQKNVCRKGHDISLIKTDLPDSRELPRFKVSFKTMYQDFFSGIYVGYEEDHVNDIPSGSFPYVLKNLYGKGSFNGWFETNPALFFESITLSSPGFSGSPIVSVHENLKVVSLLVMQRGTGSFPRYRAPSYGVANKALEEIINKIPTPELVNSEFQRWITNSADYASVNRFLSSASDIEVALLTNLVTQELQEPNNKVLDNQLYALYDRLVTSSMDFNKAAVEPHIDISVNDGWLLDSAKSRRRIGDYYSATGNSSQAIENYTVARNRVTNYASNSTTSNRASYNQKRFSDVVYEMITLNEKLQDTENKRNWQVTGALTGYQFATQSLALDLFEEKNYEQAAYYFGVAAVSDWQKRGNVPQSTVKDFQFARTKAGINTESIFDWQAFSDELNSQDFLFEKYQEKKETADFIIREFSPSDVRANFATKAATQFKFQH